MIIDLNGVRGERTPFGLEERVARSRRARQAALLAAAQRRAATRLQARTALTSILAETDPPSTA